METCYGLALRGHEVILTVRQDTTRPARDPFEFYGRAPLPALMIERQSVTGPAPARRAQYLAAALAAALRRRADVILTRDLGAAALLLRAPASSRPALVFESHGYSPAVAADLPAMVSGARAPSSRKIARLERRERLVWQRADGFVTITSALARDLARLFGGRPVDVVPDGVRLPADDDADPVSRDGPPTAVYAGHLYPWKGVDTFIDALAIAEEIHGVIVGGHPGEIDLARLTQRAEAAGILARVNFTGLVPPGDVHSRLTRGDILVLPNTDSTLSRYSSPLKLFEYMAAGRPIVASDLRSFREILREDDALFVPPGNAPALAAALRRLIADPALAQRLAASANARVRDFSWDRRAERLEVTLAAAIARHGGSTTA